MEDNATLESNWRNKVKFYRGAKVYDLRLDFYIRPSGTHSVKIMLTLKCSRCGSFFEIRYGSNMQHGHPICHSCTPGSKKHNSVGGNRSYLRTKFRVGDYVNGCKLVHVASNKSDYYELVCKYCGNHFRFKDIQKLQSNSDAHCGCQRSVYSNLPYGKNSKLYMIWVAMNSRCSNPMHKSASQYFNKKSAFNGDGIRVCKLWKFSYKEFCLWAVNAGYKEGMSIDRIYSDGDYTPFNCQILSVKENTIKANSFDRKGTKEHLFRKFIYNIRKRNWIKQMIKQGYKEEDLI